MPNKRVWSQANPHRVSKKSRRPEKSTVFRSPYQYIPEGSYRPFGNKPLTTDGRVISFPNDQALVFFTHYYSADEGRTPHISDVNWLVLCDESHFKDINNAIRGLGSKNGYTVHPTFGKKGHERADLIFPGIKNAVASVYGRRETRDHRYSDQDPLRGEELMSQLETSLPSFWPNARLVIQKSPITISSLFELVYNSHTILTDKIYEVLGNSPK